MLYVVFLFILHTPVNDIIQKLVTLNYSFVDTCMVLSSLVNLLNLILSRYFFWIMVNLLNLVFPWYFFAHTQKIFFHQYFAFWGCFLYPTFDVFVFIQLIIFIFSTLMYWSYGLVLHIVSKVRFRKSKWAQTKNIYGNQMVS